MREDFLTAAVGLDEAKATLGIPGFQAAGKAHSSLVGSNAKLTALRCQSMGAAKASQDLRVRGQQRVTITACCFAWVEVDGAKRGGGSAGERAGHR